jgi:hypothetical protein
MRCILFAASFAFVALAATNAAAQSTDVVDHANPVYRPYQLFASSNICQYQGDCAVFFPAATASETLITRVSCQFALASGGTVVGAVLSGPNSSARDIIPVFSYAPSSSSTTYGINSDVYLFFNKGEAPEFDVYSSGEPVQGLQCTVSGYIR